MAISGQETLQIGAQNSPTNSDSLWTAFNKTQNNFSTLFSEASPYNTFTGSDGVQVVSNVTTGTVSIHNTGVLSLIQGTGITLSGANGNIVVSATGGNGGAGVTSVGITSNSLSINNSPIVSSGFINLDLPEQTGMAAGYYIAPSMSVDKYGRITNITNASSFGTVTSVGVAGGIGISVSGGPVTTNGTITVTNTGVTRLTAGSGIVLTNNTGNITITATAAGGGSSNAAGNTGELQFNLSGTFSSSPNLSYDSSNNILTVGNLVSNGIVNFTTSSNVTLGTVANVHIGGGTANYVLKTDGAGNLSWTAQTSASSPAGNTGQIQFNDSGNFSANSNLSYDSSNIKLTVGNLLLIGSNSAVTYANGLMAASQISTVPSTASSTGVKGQIAFDTSYIYICIATNTWMRAAIATW